MAHWLWGQERTGMATFLQSRVSEVFTVDIHPAARIGDREVKDVAWTYAMPTPEARRGADYICFYPEKVEAEAA